MGERTGGIMSDFTPITTQEEFDNAIQARITREKEKFTQQYSDYDDIKSKNATLEKTIASQNKQIKEFTEKQSGHEKEVADLQSKITSYEKADLKIKVAREAGIPFEVAGRLSGDDEEALKKDAESFKKFLGKPKSQPLKDTEPSGDDMKKAGLKTMLGNLKM